MKEITQRRKAAKERIDPSFVVQATMRDLCFVRDLESQGRQDAKWRVEILPIADLAFVRTEGFAEDSPLIFPVRTESRRSPAKPMVGRRKDSRRPGRPSLSDELLPSKVSTASSYAHPHSFSTRLERAGVEVVR